MGGCGRVVGVWVGGWVGGKVGGRVSGCGSGMFTCQNWHVLETIFYHLRNLSQNWLKQHSWVSGRPLLNAASAHQGYTVKLAKIVSCHQCSVSYMYTATCRPNVSAEYYARYLGLGMRYEAGICTIVISTN